ncbi:hypothetical protein FKM82_021018 [Ascaphus truei]
MRTRLVRLLPEGQYCIIVQRMIPLLLCRSLSMKNHLRGVPLVCQNHFIPGNWPLCGNLGKPLNNKKRKANNQASLLENL